MSKAKKSTPKLETRIKRWYESDKELRHLTHVQMAFEADAAQLLAEYYEKQLKKKPKSPGKRAREKGAEYMRYVAKKLAVVFPFATVRSQYTGGGKDGCDVEKTAYFVEAKNCKTLAIPAWWKQLLADKAEAQDERPPALIFKLALKGRNEHLVAITLEEFVRLQREEAESFRCGPIRCGPTPDHDFFIYSGHENIGIVSPFGGVLNRVVEGKEKWEAFHYLSDCQTPFPVHNPRKGSDGLWSTLDEAEAAVRREVAE